MAAARVESSHGERRILVIADLSGYTGYLMAGEMEEAPMIAGHLVETMLLALRGAFDVAGLEGDAAFVHAPLDALTGDGLLAAIGRTHRTFQRRVESLRQATTCACEACRRVPTLDLKFFVHVGEVVRHRILDREELAGRDVILIHRLLKDSQPAREGLTRFALLTDPATRALGIDPAAHGLRPAHQAYEHLGEIAAWTGDPARWGSPSARDADASAAIGPSVLEVESDLPAPVQAVWDLLTVPELRQRWEGMDVIEEQPDEPGRGVGTLSRCVARHLSTIEELVSWSPPFAFSRRVRRPSGELLVIHDLRDAEDHTRLRVTWHAAQDARPSESEIGELRDGMRRLERAAAAVSR